MLNSQAVTESDSQDSALETTVIAPQSRSFLSIVPEPRPSFEELCAPLWYEMLQFAKKLAGGDKHTAEDVVQNAYVRAFRSWNKWVAPPRRDDHSMYARAWLFRLVQHEYIRVYNAAASERKHFGDRDAEVGESIHARPPSVLEDMVAEGFCDGVACALAKLSPDRRATVEAYYVRGMSCHEIAAELGVAVGTVWSRLNRALEDIKKLIAHEAPSLGMKQRGGPRQRRR